MKPGEMKRKILFRSAAKAGFTLVEFLVGLGVFIIILQGVIGVLIFSIRTQRKLLIEQEIADELSFASEFMSRALRMAIKDKNGTCLSVVNSSYENPGGNNTIVRFINHLQGDDCQEFFYDAGTSSLNYRRNIGAVPETLILTSPRLTIQDARFQLMGEAEGDPYQPRVTMILQAVSSSLTVPFNLETTVSQRNLDIP